MAMLTRRPGGSGGSGGLDAAAVQALIDAAIANVLGTAPAALDTLGEISDALNDSASPVNTRITTEIADQRRVIKFQLTTSSGSLTTGDGKGFFAVPAILNGHNIVAVKATNVTNSSSGNPTFQVRRVRSGAPVDVLSTALTIDSGETDSSTATPAVINAANDDLATGDILFVDCDVAGTGTAGVEVEVQTEAP